MEENKLKELSLDELYKQISLIKNEIKMKKRTIKEIDYVKTNKRPDDTALGTSRDIIEGTIKARREELKLLEAIAKGKASGMPLYFEEAVSKQKEEPVNEKRLKPCTVGEIGNYPIYEPLMERGFLVHLPECLGITESDIISCKTDVFNRTLSLEVRNSIKNRPLVTLPKLKKDEVIGDVVIDILDPTNTTIYKIIYEGCRIVFFTHPNLSYNSSEPQKLDLSITFDVYEVIDKLRKKNAL